MPILITGGCGFIGTNLANRLLGAGRTVHLFDNFARPGVENNLLWLRKRHGELLSSEPGDVRNYRSLAAAVATASEVYHLASLEGGDYGLTDPLLDFEVHARGTLHLLHAIRGSGRQIPLVFASTNRVYGPLYDLEVRPDTARYLPVSRKFKGFDETRPLNLCTPYACSKGAADSYVLDFARHYGVPAVVLRLSSIYGPHRFGSEAQEWATHFLHRIVRNQVITIYGDGKQARDLLYVEDLVEALLLARSSVDRLKGQVFNIGGGMGNAVSLIEFLQIAGAIVGKLPRIRFAPWRAGDPRVYISDTTKFRKATRWAPGTGVPEGVEQLYRWMVETRQAPV